MRSFLFNKLTICIHFILSPSIATPPPFLSSLFNPILRSSFFAPSIISIRGHDDLITRRKGEEEEADKKKGKESKKSERWKCGASQKNGVDFPCLPDRAPKKGGISRYCFYATDKYVR